MFSKICWQNPAKASLMYQQWIPAFNQKGFNYRFFELLFKTYISRTTILIHTSASTCKQIFSSFSHNDFTYIFIYLTFLTSFFFSKSTEKWLLHSFYNPIIKASKNEKKQKYRIKALHKWFFRINFDVFFQSAWIAVIWKWASQLCLAGPLTRPAHSI